MIRSVELGNFLSHSDTRLEFDNGVTVFVGNNGAGKSSIIDAITFALFGKHTRGKKSNKKSLIKIGTTEGFARVNFIINGKEFQAERKINTKGDLAALFSEKSNNDWLQIAAGERKQYGESMTQQVEKRIGLSFEKLKIASIVQQGELDSIIKAEPREFKELLNAIIRIDKLDTASKVMKNINKEFREKIKENIGYDDTNIDILERDLKKYQTELEESKPLKEKLSIQSKQLEKEISVLDSKREVEATKLEKLNQLESRKNELCAYAKKAIQEKMNEIAEKERKIRDCEGCFEYANLTEDLESKFKKIESFLEDSQKILEQLTSQKASLLEKQALAGKLKLKDNKCPVCDSVVDKLNPFFQEEHLKQELVRIEEQITELENERKQYNKKRIEFFEKLQKAKKSETILQAHSIKDQKELKGIQHEVDLQKKSMENVTQTITTSNLVEVAQLDTHAKKLYDTISQLQEETKGFGESEIINLKESISEKRDKLYQINQDVGAVTQNITKSTEQIKIIKSLLVELEIVREYLEEMDSIQTNVFNREGPVATSLRSWALNIISTKASEYLSLLNTKIQRVWLAEKKHSVLITCYSKNEVLDLGSLSGGERISVALALRLGMASILGNSGLNLMILDEPTTHLDAERRKALVGVLSQLSNITNAGIPMQFIIITHDVEIFEDSSVEKIYKFESSGQETKVIPI